MNILDYQPTKSYKKPKKLHFELKREKKKMLTNKNIFFIKK